MNCVDCRAVNPDENVYCGKCGAELGRTLEETIRKRGLRDRQATEFDITEAVIERVWKRLLWYGGSIALVLGVFGWTTYKDFKSSVETGKQQIIKSVQDALTDISSTRQQTKLVKTDVEQLQSDVAQYRKVNDKIQKLQADVLAVKNKTVDLGPQTTVKVGTLVTATKFDKSGKPEGGGFAFGVVGCPPSLLDQGERVGFCAQGDPPLFSQRNPAGEVRPVASLSSIGFQDASVGPKPACTTSTRGTLYVEKGSGRASDKPFICIKKSDGNFGWVELTATQ